MRKPWWLRERATERRLGGTDAAKLLGVSKYGTAQDVYDRIVHGKEKPKSKYMDRGLKVEPELRRRYVEATGATLVLRPEDFIVQHDIFHWATCSPDDITTDSLVVDYKSVNRWSKGWRDGPPDDYTLQMMWNMWVLDLPRAHIYAAFGADEKDGSFKIVSCYLYPFERDPGLDLLFTRVGHHFWTNHVEALRPPVVATPSGAEASP